MDLIKDKNFIQKTASIILNFSRVWTIGCDFLKVRIGSEFIFIYFNKSVCTDSLIVIFSTCSCFSAQGPSFGDSVIFVLARSFKGSLLGNYYLLFKGPL